MSTKTEVTQHPLSQCQRAVLVEIIVNSQDGKPAQGILDEVGDGRLTHVTGAGEKAEIIEPYLVRCNKCNHEFLTSILRPNEAVCGCGGSYFPVLAGLVASLKKRGLDPEGTTKEVVAMVDEAITQHAAPPAPATAQAEPSGDEWKPIETAPKNGTEFIGLSGDELAICSWEPLDNPVAKHWGIAGTWHRKAVASGKDLMGTFSPTHWTRLPGRDAIKAAMGRGR